LFQFKTAVVGRDSNPQRDRFHRCTGVGHGAISPITVGHSRSGCYEHLT
jgi:hypothetical protein